MEDDSDVKGGPLSIPKPSAKSLDDGYNQTYVIMRNNSPEDKSAEEDHPVFFRCGNWCYKGQIQFNGLKIGISDLPLLIPTLQKQQGSLQYFCSSVNVPSSSEYAAPLKFLREATEFVANEMTSASIEKELRKMSSVFPWIDADGAATYFEMTLNNIPSCMGNVALVASKTYARGLIIISIYSEKVLYFVIQSGEGDQPLLDVRFPDVSKHGQGLLLQSYNNSSSPYRKLTLWHILEYDTIASIERIIPKIRTINISTANYQQTYCVLKSCFDTAASNFSVHHDVLFRFGSWCYAGRVQLTPTLTLSDIPFVIPALRMQQGRLDFYCDVSNIPTNSPFAKSLEYMQKLEPLIENQIYNSEEVLQALISRLSKMGLGETVVKWLDGESSNSFFEFKLAQDTVTSTHFKDIELVASKCYHPSGVITITIVFQETIYVTVLDGDKENPLLDSRFPDVSGKGRGYQIQTLKAGLPEWPELRKVSIWQTVGALEEVFRDRAVLLAQRKGDRQVDSDEACAEGDGSSGSGSSGEGAAKETESGRERERGQWEDSCSPLHSPSSRSDGNSNNEISDVAEEKSASRIDKSGQLFSPRDNNIEDVNMAIIGAKMGDKGTSPLTSPAKETFEERGGHKVDTVSTPESRERNSPSEIASPSQSGLNLSTPGKGSVLGSRGGLGGSSSTARPHHIPKMDNPLSQRMDEIRRSLGDGAITAPWDFKGRPLKSLNSIPAASGISDSDGSKK